MELEEHVAVAAAARPLHAVAIPLPAQGHLNPLMRLCRALASRHGFLITFVNIQPIHDRILDCMQNHPTGPDAAQDGHPVRSPPLPIRRVSLPINGLDLENDFRLSFADFLIATRSLSNPLESFLQSIGEEGSGLPPVTCLISDNFMSGAVQNVAEKLGIPWVSYFPCSQSMNLLYFYTHTGRVPLQDAIHLSMDRDKPMELFKDDLPGLPPLYNRDMPPYKHVVEESPRIIPLMVDLSRISNEKASAILVNTFKEIEGEAMWAMAEQLITPPIFGIGPLVEVLEEESSTDLWKEESHCLQWLDAQPAQSVLYISFGSITLLSSQQFGAILDGLQASGHRFLWAFRPDLVEGHATDEAIHENMLPQEFVEATRDRSCFVEWAPQVRVLNHSSVRGFLTHCGWNSTIEAIAAGVPMLCWPYLCDQHTDAKFIVEVWKVGLRFEAPSSKGGIIDSREVESVVRALMEGEEGLVLRKHSALLRQSALSSLQAAGFSNRQLQAFVQHICNISS
ncbi:hypothetical protein GOP47_0007230 [Adiantum capillus-veneris]|uniref:Glycosyltransferase n=1 Tax=Adiantum capillus-veneris TaxID=13818 RepID=A0A9D4V0W6_ADICA|nr:hypothetical protein GOP47_0007230 [Adiantum capillus-veneris]